MMQLLVQRPLSHGFDDRSKNFGIVLLVRGFVERRRPLLRNRRVSCRNDEINTTETPCAPFTVRVPILSLSLRSNSELLRIAEFSTNRTARKTRSVNRVIRVGNFTSFLLASMCLPWIYFGFIIRSFSFIPSSFPHKKIYTQCMAVILSFRSRIFFCSTQVCILRWKLPEKINTFFSEYSAIIPLALVTRFISR